MYFGVGRLVIRRFGGVFFRLVVLVFSGGNVVRFDGVGIFRTCSFRDVVFRNLF